MAVRAVLFDFGGVILSSPFDAFARYEADNGLPDGFLRQLNANNPDDNAWARLERGEVDLVGFCELFEEEARTAGHNVQAAAVLELLSGELRPEMAEVVKRCSQRLKTALLTNNFVGFERASSALHPHSEVLGYFDVIIESSKTGVRKPDRRFYEIACDQLAIEPEEAVFLDDLGINLKPARAMGMQTIKVVDPADAITELEDVVGFPLR